MDHQHFSLVLDKHPQSSDSGEFVFDVIQIELNASVLLDSEILSIWTELTRRSTRVDQLLCRLCLSESKEARSLIVLLL